MNDDLDSASPEEETPAQPGPVPEPEETLPAFLASDWSPLPEEARSAEPEVEYLPPEWPAAAHRTRSRAWLWAIPTILLVAACAYLVVQNRAAAATVAALSIRLPQLLLPPGSPNPLEAQLRSVSTDAGAWNFLRAQQKTRALALPPSLQGQMPGAAVGVGPEGLVPPGGPGESAPNVTPQAAAFFQEHPDLEQRFTGYADEARALRDQGKDVQPLRVLRQQILDAATQGDLRQVTALLDQFAQGLRELGGSAEPGEMQQLLADFQQAFERAQQQGRDPRAAVALMKQAEAAVQAGKRGEAMELARKALAAMRNAPRGRGGRPAAAHGRGPAGPPPGRAEQILRGVFQMLEQEDRDLAVTHQAVEQALSAQLQDDPRKMREVLATARESLLRLHERRVAFSEALKGKQPAPGPQTGGPPAPGSERPAGPGPGAFQIPHEAVEKFGELLETIRAMSAEEFQAARDNISRKLIGLILGEPGPGKGSVRRPLTFPPGMSAEDRIREKLRAAQEPYREMKAQGQDVGPLSDLLREAREDLAAGRLVAAEGKVDAALRVLGLLPREQEQPPPLSLERPLPPLLPSLPKEEPPVLAPTEREPSGTPAS